MINYRRNITGGLSFILLAKESSPYFHSWSHKTLPQLSHFHSPKLVPLNALIGGFHSRTSSPSFAQAFADPPLVALHSVVVDTDRRDLI
ncbi:hypothetical protein LR48_Vigan09g064900 [Vigna angularis]|uniref:Uncharacterized protein n=1 Tax=Phaseolus angularis TaxID=3914 RepID=A0A0L9VAA8_PHAAN|nr:hypothetical protein LR48_Vigan09g064900 [Vigna angularis]